MNSCYLPSHTRLEDNLRPRFTQSISGEAYKFDPSQRHVIGVLQGEGVGSEVVPVAMHLLAELQKHTQRQFEIHQGGLIGYPAIDQFGSSLSPDVIDFTSSIFAAKGALFCGPGGERFVYELRKKFGLFCKFTPLEPIPELASAGVVRPEVVNGVDIVAVRENSGGVYQGTWSTEKDETGQSIAKHQFMYSDEMVVNILTVAMTLAVQRKKRVHVILKPSGVPSITQLWRKHAEALAAEFGVELVEFEIDNAVYQLIANPKQFDVLVSPNLFGDVLADCGSVLLASRGLSYSGNFNEKGHAVFQTGHGAARDIAGQDIANPIAQILSLGMMLRESFDWPLADAALRSAVKATLKNGYCTQDIAMPNHKTLGTEDFGKQVMSNLKLILAGREL